uniref:Uncharacterized protein n=1 Tax=Oryza brachyantha TaxID=4533 RepID=J3MU15_ORYBR
MESAYHMRLTLEHYTCMVDLLGQLDGVAKVRAGSRRRLGCSYVEHMGKVHLFMADNHSHPQAKRIYELVVKLEQMVKEKTGGGGVVEKNGDTATAAGTAVPFVGFRWWTRRKWISKC